MYNFILEISMVVALGAVLLVLARAMPRVSDPDGGNLAPPSKFERLVEKVPLHKIDQWLNDSWIKILKKAKIVIMKVDHRLAQKLSTMKASSDNGNSLKEKMELLAEVKSEKPQDPPVSA